ncbi:MAG: transporter substrate-binding domain-containing protein [Bacteroidales bacterium]|jgi:polar amino acid transport system substrate-binding protein
MKRLTFVGLAILTMVLTSCNKEDTTGKNLTILTEVMKPYNYEENGVQKGITMEVVQQIMDELKLRNTIEIITVWDSVYHRLQTEENIMAFTTGLTPDRKDLFKWVGPVGMWHASFISLKNNDLTISTIESAKLLPSIGVGTASFSGEILKDLGFTNLVYFENLAKLVGGLYDGTVAAIFDSPDLLRLAALDQSLDASELTSLLIYSSTPAYLAFSKDVPAKVVKSWQDKLNELKDAGILQELYDKYLPGTPAPGRILMFTEENPPQSFMDEEGNLTGSSVEMVKTMLEGSSLAGPIELTNWTDAYNQLQLVPNTMVFSTLRSPERESLFHWVGPVCKKRYCFFVHSNSDFHIGTITDARLLESVGTVKGWASEQELKNLGFTNIVTWATPQEVFQKLMDGEISCAVLNDIAIAMLAAESAHAQKDYRKEAVLSEGQTYLAFSKDTDPSYLTAWTDAYNSLVSSGKLGTIWMKWYPDIEW